MDRVRSGKVIPWRHYVPYFICNRSGHARFNRSDGPKNSSNHPRRFFRVDGQRDGANSAAPADGFEERDGTNSATPADGFEERNGANSAASADDFEKREGTNSAAPADDCEERDGTNSAASPDGFEEQYNALVS